MTSCIICGIEDSNFIKIPRSEDYLCVYCFDLLKAISFGRNILNFPAVIKLKEIIERRLRK